MLPSPSLRRVIWYTALQYETIISLGVAFAVWEDFVPAQCHNNLISSHLVREIYIFFYRIVVRCKANGLAWLAVHTLTLKPLMHSKSHMPPVQSYGLALAKE